MNLNKKKELNLENDKIYQEATELLYSMDIELTINEKINIIDKVIKICPYHYSAKLAKLDLLRANSEEYLNLAHECKNFFLEYIDIDEDNPDGNLWYSGGRMYLQILFNLGLQYIEEKKYDNAVSIFEKMLKLDENSKLEQEIHLLISYLLKEDYNTVINYLKKLPDELPPHYDLALMFANVGLKNQENTCNIVKKLNSYSKYYLGVMTGMIKLTDEDFMELSCSELYEPRSLDEACTHIRVFSPIIEKLGEQLANIITTKQELIDEIMPTEDDMKVLSILIVLKKANQKQIVNILAGTSQKYSKLSKKYKLKLSKVDAINMLDETVNKQFIDYIKELDIYVISPLGYSILTGLFESEELNKNDDYELLF